MLLTTSGRDATSATTASRSPSMYPTAQRRPISHVVFRARLSRARRRLRKHLDQQPAKPVTCADTVLAPQKEATQ